MQNKQNIKDSGYRILKENKNGYHAEGNDGNRYSGTSCCKRRYEYTERYTQYSCGAGSIKNMKQMNPSIVR
ncbi:MAG: hypothetical protein RR865_01900 [Clostridia bacterium]